MNENQCFGMEVEFATSEMQAVRAFMRLHYNDQNSFNWNHYHDSDNFGRYQFQSDSSCGYELITPILQGDTGLVNGLDHIATLFSSEDVFITQQCGIHYHFGYERTAKDISSLLALWGLVENIILSTFPVARINGRFCRRIFSEGLNLGLLQASLDGLANYEELMNFVNLDKYRALNIKTMRRTKTVEFRLLEGTREIDTIKNYCLVFEAIVSQAKATNWVKKIGKQTPLSNMEELGKILKLNIDLVNFLTLRQTEFVRE